MLSDQDKKEIAALFSNAFAQGVNELIAPGMSRMLEDMDDIKNRVSHLETKVDRFEETSQSHSAEII